MIIYVMGVPGTGKTTFSQLLSNDLGTVPLISTDIVKSIVCEYFEKPILQKVSYSAWELLGEFNTKNVIDGYEIFSRALFSETYKITKAILQTYSLTIVEGLGINPDMIKDTDDSYVTILLRNLNLTKHQMHKLRIRNDKINHWNKHADAISKIETHLTFRAKSLFPDLICCDTSNMNLLRTTITQIVGSRMKYV
jgi:2-phosphoglycerate kinase